MLPYVMGETKGAGLDTGQIQQVIEENILPATADNNGQRINLQRRGTSFGLER